MTKKVSYLIIAGLLAPVLVVYALGWQAIWPALYAELKNPQFLYRGIPNAQLVKPTALDPTQGITLSNSKHAPACAGLVWLATISVDNGSKEAIGNIEITCDHYNQAVDRLRQVVRVLHGDISAGSTRTFTNVNMGFASFGTRAIVCYPTRYDRADRTP